MQELIKALIKARAELPSISKGQTATVVSKKTNVRFSYSYASLPDILEAATPVLLSHGLVIINTVNEGLLTVALWHESGENIASSYRLSSGADPQQLGSELTYFRRYLLCGLIGIAPDDDDDGSQAARKSPTSSPATSTRSANYQATKPAAKEAAAAGDPLALLKRNVSRAFSELAWSREQITEWNQTYFGGRASAAWSTEDWQKAVTMLDLLVDQDLAN
jgi:hypothetical protein